MIFATEYPILISSAVILAIIWITYSYLTLRNDSTSSEWRNVLFCLIAFLGLFLLINVPGYREKQLFESAYLSPDKIESPHSFQDVHQFLNAEVASRCDTLHIKGAFLSNAELALLKDYNIVFHSDTLVPGIHTIHWPKNINENENWSISGAIQGSTINELFLTDPSGITSKASIKDSLFSFETKGLSPGFYLYEVSTITDKDTISYKLPIEVKESPQWSLLMLLSYPNPEANYLKNYWIALGHGFSMKTQISKEKFKTSFANTNIKDLSKINRSLLKKFNFIYLDLPTWNKLAPSERKAILNANRNDGLAILWVPTAIGQTVVDYKLPAINNSLERELPNMGGAKIVQYELGTNWRKHILNNIELGAYRNYGLGIQFIISTQNSYQLLLTGAEKQYRSIWSDILSRSYRNYSNRATLILPDIMWAYNDYQIQLLTNQALKTAVVLDDTITIDLLEEPFIDHSYNFNYPAQEGIHTLHLPDLNESFTYYVNAQDDWPAIQQKKNRKVAMIAQALTFEKAVDPIYLSKPYPIAYWLALTFIGFGLLWLNERMY